MALVSRGEQAINERYRPMRLSEMIGNEQTKANLVKWMDEGEKRAKSLLLCGDSSAGKTTTAKVLAMGLNCEQGDTTEPCLECESCKAAMRGEAFHILELNMADLTGKDDTSEITESMYQAAMTGRNKVYILDEVQMLSRQAQNQLLKVVEKPPQNVYLVFCTTEPEKLIPTLRNRMAKFNYRKPSDKEIGAMVKDVMAQEGWEFTLEEKRILFEKIKGMSYREILFTCEQFAKTRSIDGIESIREAEKYDPYPMAREIVYKTDATLFLNAVDNGVNINCEGLRLLLVSLCSKKLRELWFNTEDEALKYYNALNELTACKMYDSNSIHQFTALVWRVCAELKG